MKNIDLSLEMIKDINANGRYHPTSQTNESWRDFLNQKIINLIAIIKLIGHFFFTIYQSVMKEKRPFHSPYHFRSLSETRSLASGKVSRHTRGRFYNYSYIGSYW